MKLSREKILAISHRVLEFLDGDDAVEYYEDPQQIRQQIVRMIESEMKADELIDGLVRRKIETQKRTIVEGSDEWEVLYRKYYEEEQAKHRKVMP